MKRKNKKIYYIDCDGLNSRVKYGYLNRRLDYLLPDDLVDVKIGSEIIQIKKKDIYFTKDQANFRLNIYLAKRKYKIKNKNEICKCYYCKRKLRYEEFTVDHKKCISKFPELAANEDNFVISCEDCNQEKSDQDFFEFRQGKKIDAEANEMNLVIEKKKITKSKKVTEKISRTLNCNAENVMDIAKRDSRIWDVETFFNKNNCSV